jgi:hypothetical protein
LSHFYFHNSYKEGRKEEREERKEEREERKEEGVRKKGDQSILSHYSNALQICL